MDSRRRGNDEFFIRTLFIVAGNVYTITQGNLNVVGTNYNIFECFEKIKKTAGWRNFYFFLKPCFALNFGLSGSIKITCFPRRICLILPRFFQAFNELKNFMSLSFLHGDYKHIF